MWAVVMALAITMWIWVAASLHMVRWCFNKSDAALQLVYLAAITALGVVALLLLPYLVLPASVLSHGWTREVLEKTQLTTIMVLGVVAVVALLRAHFILLPATNAKAITAVTAKSGVAGAAKHKPVKNKPVKKQP